MNAIIKFVVIQNFGSKKQTSLNDFCSQCLTYFKKIMRDMNFGIILL